MSFLTPLYLIGALGLAIPIILHLLHDRPKNKQVFGSLMFLDKTKPPVDRKRRPTHLLLLLLRCLALLLLVFVSQGRPASVGTSRLPLRRAPLRGWA